MCGRVTNPENSKVEKESRMKSLDAQKSIVGIRRLIGETLVIVFGVLIAIGLDDYWTRQQEQDLELQYLQRIHEDLRADIQFIGDYYVNGLRTKLNALDAIAPVVRGHKPIPGDLELFLKNVSLGGIMGASKITWVQDDTFQDLKFTGNLRLIRNANLRQKISSYYLESDGITVRAEARLTGYVAFVHSQVPAELRSEMRLEDMQKFGMDRAAKRFTSEEFQDLLNKEYNLAYFLRYLNLGPESAQLARELEEYIQELEAGS